MNSRTRTLDLSGTDEAAMLISACCLAHCISVPLLLALLPGLTDLLNAGNSLHLVFSGLTVLFSVVILLLGYDHHRLRKVLAWGILGAVLIALASLSPADCCSAILSWAAGKISVSEVPPVSWGVFLLTPLGTLSLILAHLENRRGLRTHAEQGCT